MPEGVEFRCCEGPILILIATNPVQNSLSSRVALAALCWVHRGGLVVREADYTGRHLHLALRGPRHDLLIATNPIRNLISLIYQRVETSLIATDPIQNLTSSKLSLRHVR